ncbi:LysR family transcriptional regulator [Streptomyces sp. Iso 434]|uniref:LysR family transcriptional regulator n=1 Tax=Streptomyces sp. Iso 434 TaxID=3062272 RepID=UPI00397EC71C
MPLAPRMPDPAFDPGQQRLDQRPQLIVDVPRLRPRHRTPPDQHSRSDPTTSKIISLGVLSGQGASERLRRFAAASAFPSLGAAASGLGLNTFTLVAQINRIERELGGPLLVRAERGRPMTLTPLGRRVLRAIRTSQDGAGS